MAFLNENGLSHLWSKINSALTNKANANDVSALEERINELEETLANKQDKISSWSDLKG